MALLNEDGKELPLTWSQTPNAYDESHFGDRCRTPFTFTNIDAEPIPSLPETFQHPSDYVFHKAERIYSSSCRRTKMSSTDGKQDRS